MAEALQGNHFTSIVRSTYIHPGEAQLQWTEAESEQTPSRQTHTFMCKNTHTHTEIQTHRHFYSFLIRFPRKCDECAKGFCRCRCHQHTYTLTQQQPQHIHMNLHGYICVCVCVCGCVEPPLAVSPTALLLLLLLLSLSCERAPVFVDFGVCLGQRQ